MGAIDTLSGIGTEDAWTAQVRAAQSAEDAWTAQVRASQGLDPDGLPLAAAKPAPKVDLTADAEILKSKDLIKKMLDDKAASVKAETPAPTKSNAGLIIAGVILILGYLYLKGRK